MSLLGIGSSSQTMTAAPVGVLGMSATQLPSGGGMPIPGQGAVPGALTAQPGGAMSIIKKMLVGGAVGGVLGAGVGLLPAGFLGPVGALSVPIGAAIGAGAGALLGLVKGLVDRRKENLALKASQNGTMVPGSIPNGAGMPPSASISPLKGKVFTRGDQSPQIRWTQKSLKKLGIYRGKLTGRLDAKTESAIRKYEVMKGAMPSGDVSPDLRAAISMDVRALRQYA